MGPLFFNIFNKILIWEKKPVDEFGRMIYHIGGIWTIRWIDMDNSDA